MTQQAFFHDESRAVRFWVLVEGALIGASIGKTTLHYRYEPHRNDDDPLATFLAHADEIEAAVKRRLAAGSREPVMLRDWDVRPEPQAAA
jgi:hypothetical protein